MIKIRFLDDNTFLVKFNGEKKEFDKYITKITSKLLYCAKPNIANTGGWIFHYNKLQEILKTFNNKVVYDNEYTPPVYSNMGNNMLLQPYDYQKEAIYFAINNLNSLMVLPCGAGKH